MEGLAALLANFMPLQPLMTGSEAAAQGIGQALPTAAGAGGAAGAGNIGLLGKLLGLSPETSQMLRGIGSYMGKIGGALSDPWKPGARLGAVASEAAGPGNMASILNKILSGGGGGAPGQATGGVSKPNPTLTQPGAQTSGSQLEALGKSMPPSSMPNIGPVSSIEPDPSGMGYKKINFDNSGFTNLMGGQSPFLKALWG